VTELSSFGTWKVGYKSRIGAATTHRRYEEHHCLVPNPAIAQRAMICKPLPSEDELQVISAFRKALDTGQYFVNAVRRVQTAQLKRAVGWTDDPNGHGLIGSEWQLELALLPQPYRR
jgi:hypothetical protein